MADQSVRDKKCRESIQMIEQFAKKKKISKTKTHLLDFISNIREELVTKSHEILVEHQLKILDQAYKFVYPHGGSYNNFEEWSLVCTTIGWLHSEKSQGDLASVYFERWYDLLIRYMTKFRTIPDYDVFPNDAWNYFDFFSDTPKGLEKINKLLQLSKLKVTRNHANLLWVKAELLTKIGKIKRALKLYQQTEKIFTKCKLDYTLGYLQILDDTARSHLKLRNVEEALRYRIKLFVKVQQPPNPKDPKISHLAYETFNFYLNFSQLLLDEYEDYATANIFLERVHEQQWLRYVEKSKV